MSGKGLTGMENRRRKRGRKGERDRAKELEVRASQKEEAV